MPARFQLRVNQIPINPDLISSAIGFDQIYLRDAIPKLFLKGAL